VTDAVSLTPRRPALLPGLSVAIAVAATATLCGQRAPLVGAPVFALAIGIIVAAASVPSATLQPGLAFASRAVLQSAIVVSGFGLSLAAVIRTGAGTLPVTFVTITIALVLGPLCGRALRLDRAAVTLNSVGTAICGASAIGAVAAVLKPAEAEVTLAIAVIFCYNVIAALAFPPIGHALHLSQQAFGIWAGTAVNDTSSVIAAGYAYGIPAGSEATIVKLTRAVFILPIVAALALARAARHRTEERVPWRSIVPWFIGWFVLAALANTIGIVPAAWHATIASLAVALISIALAAIGLQTNIDTVFRAGWRPLLLGFLLWVAVASTSLLVQHFVAL